MGYGGDGRMTRYSQRLLLLVAVVFLGACSSKDHPGETADPSSVLKQGREDPHTTPAAVVEAFFKAMEMDDRKTMATLMAPKRAARMEKPGSWDAWLAVWKRVTVVRVGEVLTENGTDGNLPNRVKVRVEYRQGERTLKERVTVARIDGRWYWDEN